jgi:hypothetical protein
MCDEALFLNASLELALGDNRMRRFAFFLALAASLTLVAPTQASSVVVAADSGGGSVNVTGTAAGATITDSGGAQITTVTPTSGPTLTGLSLPLSIGTFTITDNLGNITGSGTKTIGTGASAAIETFSITSGFVLGTNIVLDGVITAVTQNSLPGYDFSEFANPGSAIVLTIAKTGTNFGLIVNHAGTSADSAGYGVQESAGAAVPEPTSLALLGIGMAGFFTYRRLFKRTGTA